MTRRDTARQMAFTARAGGTTRENPIYFLSTICQDIAQKFAKTRHSRIFIQIYFILHFTLSLCFMGILFYRLQFCGSKNSKSGKVGKKEIE